MQINDRKFIAEGDPQEVLSKFKKFLDETIDNADVNISSPAKAKAGAR